MTALNALAEGIGYVVMAITALVGLWFALVGAIHMLSVRPQYRTARVARRGTTESGASSLSTGTPRLATSPRYWPWQ